jgi:hypothetical protein
MKKLAILTMVAALMGGMFSAPYPVQSASQTEVKEMFVSYDLRQGPFFKLRIKARYLIREGQEVGREIAEQRARLALKGLRPWGWVSNFRGIESSTVNFFIEVNVTAIVLADQPPPVTVTRISIFKPGGILVASRDIDNLENPTAYQDTLAFAVQMAQVEAMTEGKEIWCNSAATCPSAGEELGRNLLK